VIDPFVLILMFFSLVSRHHYAAAQDIL